MILNRIISLRKKKDGHCNTPLIDSGLPRVHMQVTSPDIVVHH